jgi:HK97 family phage portal protein
MFASLLRAGPDDRSAWGNFWFQPVGMGTASGVRVDAAAAMKLSAVYACVRVLTESFAILPFNLYTPKVGGGRTKVTDHWLVRLFTKRPNSLQNPFEWREMLQGHLVLRGAAYCRIIPDGTGGIAELIPMHPDRVTTDPLSNGSYRYIYKNPNGETERLARTEVWCVRGLSSDGMTAMSPIELQREVLGAALSAQDYGNRFFANDAKPTGGWIEIPGNIADTAARDKIKESVKEATGGRNRHKTMILDRGMKYHEVGLTNKDSQFLESRQFSRTEIAAMFRVPPHMIGDLSRATFSNIEQQAIDFWMGSMLPWTERWEAAIEALLGEEEELEIEFDFRNLLRGDAVSRAAYIHSGVLDGWLTRNEGRELEGYDPIAGLDEPLVPVNERGINDPLPQPGAAPAKPDPQPAQPTPDDANARLAALLAGNTARLARRFSKAEVATLDAELIADALAITPAVAQNWLADNAAVAFTEQSLAAAFTTLAGLK